MHDRRTTLNRKQERKMRLILVNVYEHHLLYKKYHNRKICIIVPWDETFIPSYPMDPCFVPTRPMGHSRQIICPIPSHRSMFRPNTSHGIFRRSNFHMLGNLNLRQIQFKKKKRISHKIENYSGIAV